jgi:hypothetical protein
MPYIMGLNTYFLTKFFSFLLPAVASFDVEWNQFCQVLETVPSKNQQTILSQLLIMTNGRTKSARFKMAKQVSLMIVQTAPEPAVGGEEKEARNARLKSNLQLFAKLHREQRKQLGKKIFERIAKLYGAAGKNLKS